MLAFKFTRKFSTSQTPWKYHAQSDSALERHKKVMKVINSSEYTHNECRKYLCENSMSFKNIYQGRFRYVEQLYDAIYFILYKCSFGRKQKLTRCNEELLVNIYTMAGIEDSLGLLIKAVEEQLNSKVDVIDSIDPIDPIDSIDPVEKY